MQILLTKDSQQTSDDQGPHWVYLYQTGLNKQTTATYKHTFKTLLKGLHLNHIYRGVLSTIQQLLLFNHNVNNDW